VLFSARPTSTREEQQPVLPPTVVVLLCKHLKAQAIQTVFAKKIKFCEFQKLSISDKLIYRKTQF
jgi:hypothetical protein